MPDCQKETMVESFWFEIIEHLEFVTANDRHSPDSNKRLKFVSLIGELGKSMMPLAYPLCNNAAAAKKKTFLKQKWSFIVQEIIV